MGSPNAQKNTIHYEKQKCKYCQTEYKVPITAPGLMFFCPKCNSSNGSISDYGFGPIVPCDIYEGEHLIGRVSGGGGEYRLESEAFGLNEALSQGYKDLAVYHEAEDIIRKCLTGKKRLFQYRADDDYDLKHGTLLDAFSIDIRGNIYYWNKSNSKITTVGADIDRNPDEKRTFDIPVYSAGGINGSQRMVSAISSRNRRSNAINKCVTYVDSYRFIEKIIDNNREKDAAALITQITSIKELKDRTVVRCRIRYSSGMGGVLDIPILKTIQNYEELILELKSFMEKTGDLDKDSEEGIKKRKMIKLSIIITVIGILMFVIGLIGVVLLGMKPEPDSSVATAGALGIGGVFIGCIGAGIHFKYRD